MTSSPLIKFYKIVSLSRHNLNIHFLPGYPLERQQSYMHQYHYPDLGNPEMEGLLEATRRGTDATGRRVQGRFLPIGDPRSIRGLSSRQFQHHALLDPPLHQPYVNNDDDIIDDEEDIDFFGPQPLLATRRINSFESLQQHAFRQGKCRPECTLIY